MDNKTMSAKVLNITKTTSEWVSFATTVIPKGLLCVEQVLTDGNISAIKFKVGDGTTQFSSLLYAGGVSVSNEVAYTNTTSGLTATNVQSAIDEIVTMFASYYTKTEIDSKISGIFTLKGRVDTVGGLPTENNHDGDVYLVGLTTATEYSEYYWLATNSRWEFLGTTVDVDLSNYYTKSEITTLLANKVDIEEGKGLSSNDYTTAEKEKLASLLNITIDDTLSDTSENPVQNNVIKASLDTKIDETDTLILNCIL